MLYINPLKMPDSLPSFYTNGEMMDMISRDDIPKIREKFECLLLGNQRTGPVVLIFRGIEEQLWFGYENSIFRVVKVYNHGHQNIQLSMNYLEAVWEDWKNYHGK